MSDTHLRDALTIAAGRFRWYEKLHREKTPPDEEKARSNAEMAERCELALKSAPAAIETGGTFREGVEKAAAWCEVEAAEADKIAADNYRRRGTTQHGSELWAKEQALRHAADAIRALQPPSAPEGGRETRCTCEYVPVLAMHEPTCPQHAWQARALAAEQEVKRLREETTKADMWWDADDPEQPLYDPEDYFDSIGGEGPFLGRLMRARRLPDAWFVGRWKEPRGWAVEEFATEEEARALAAKQGEKADD